MTAASSVLLLMILATSGQMPPAGREPDELFLQQLGITADAESLLAIVRGRSGTPLRADEIRAAIDTIRTGTEAQRSAAQLKLLAAGPGILPYLRRASRELE